CFVLLHEPYQCVHYQDSEDYGCVKVFAYQRRYGDCGHEYPYQRAPELADEYLQRAYLVSLDYLVLPVPENPFFSFLIAEAFRSGIKSIKNFAIFIAEFFVSV
ncbi:MAG: hypothetical protein HW383_777, partial [Candidatus Magasanikbacteria bacterium]|nr:hypothetical protein [Candidatus Magasanikbacteria bacterium]